MSPSAERRLCRDLPIERSTLTKNEQIGAPTGAPIQGQIKALCGNSTDGGKIPEECFDQGKTRGKTLLAVSGDSRQGKNNRRRGTRTPDIHGVNVAL